MPEPSSFSVETISEQDYIGKTVAITLLQELLKEVVIDEEVKNTLLEQFSQNLEESFQKPEWVQELSLTFEEMEGEFPLERVEKTSAYIVDIRLLLCHPHSIHCPLQPPLSPSAIPPQPPQPLSFPGSGPHFGSTGSMMGSSSPIHTPPPPPRRKLHFIHQPTLP